MPKTSWNDINDSDSSLSSEPEEIQAKKDDKLQNINPKKEATTGLKAACDQYSWEKLQKHANPYIWLYITNSYNEQADEIHDFLAKSNLFSQIIRLNKVGWNVETTLLKGRQLLLQGMKNESRSIKFIYSNRNEENKGQKKVTYVEKGTPILHKHHTFNEETNRVNGVEEDGLASPKTKGMKQKNKWVEKSVSMGGNSDLKRLESPKYKHVLRECKSPKRYVEKMPSLKSDSTQEAKKEAETFAAQKNQQPQKAEKVQIVTSPIKQKQEKQQQKAEKQQQKAEKQQRKVEKQQQKVEKQQQEVEKQVQTNLQITEQRESQLQKEEQESQEQQKQQKKKKQKKRREGKGNKQQNKSQKKDNNPFSYFSRI